VGKKFDFEKFKKKKIAVHCKTQEEFGNFVKKCSTVDMNLASPSSAYFESYGNATCIDFDYSLHYENFSWYKSENYTILEWSDYMKKEFTKADLKPGMVVQYRSGDFRMVMEISDGELHLIGASSHTELKDFKDDLTVDWGDLNRDIIFVYSLSAYWKYALTIGTKGRTVLFERKEPLKMTVEEAEAKLSELLEKEIKIEDE